MSKFMKLYESTKKTLKESTEEASNFFSYLEQFQTAFDEESTKRINIELKSELGNTTEEQLVSMIQNSPIALHDFNVSQYGEEYEQNGESVSAEEIANDTFISFKEEGLLKEETEQIYIWVQHDKKGEFEPHMSFDKTKEGKEEAAFEIQDLKDGGHEAKKGDAFPIKESTRVIKEDSSGSAIVGIVKSINSNSGTNKVTAELSDDLNKITLSDDFESFTFSKAGDISHLS